MLKEERFDHILLKLQHNRKVTLGELSEDLQVSEDTVRRDIEVLSQNGRLTKVRGGAIPHSPNALVHKFTDRIHLSENDKEVIARKAVTMLTAGQTILLDGGTTTYYMASLLPPEIELTVITNNIPIAGLLIDHPTINVILAGGRVFKSSRVTLGMEAIKLFNNTRADFCFTGICSLHHQFGITGPHLEEAEVKRTMVQAANRVVAVTTLNKIETAESFVVCGIDTIDTIITEAEPDSVLFETYKNLGIHIL